MYGAAVAMGLVRCCLSRCVTLFVTRTDQEGTLLGGCSQSGHFRLVFGAARKAGILPPEGASGPRVTHVGFGLVLGEDGKRLKTRSSEVPRSAAHYSYFARHALNRLRELC